jgi:outer membrane protein TolC
MMLSWSLLALSLVGVQDQQPSPPIVPRSPISIDIRINKTSRGAADEASLAATTCSSRALLEEICANLCPEDILDELTIAAYSRATEPTSEGKPDAPGRQLESTASTPPVTMPKVAKPRTISDPEAKEIWPMTLREAMRIALDNSEIVRVKSFGGFGLPVGCDGPKGASSDRGPIVIARLNADASLWRFQAEVMAELRSVEQQYWNLAAAHVQLWAADRAVSLAKEVLDRERAESHMGRGTVADVAEAAQRLEQFNLDLVTRTSDVITAERQLRNLLGLPPADNRRIIPATPATEARLEPDWNSSLAEMLAQQPDIVQQRILVRIAELQLLIARNQLLPQLSLNALSQFNGLGQSLDRSFAVMSGAMLKALDPVIANAGRAAGPNQNPGVHNDFLTWQEGFTFQMPLGRSPLTNARQSQYVLLRARAYYQQVVHQTTHSLARFFLEIDANYKQLRTATRLRQAAAQRLDAQRAYYEEGRITIDRFLDAVSQYTTAVATEAQYKATYNISIIALEEAKGTLLAYDNVVLADGPYPGKASPAQPARADLANGHAIAQDNQVKTASFESEKPKKIEVPPAKTQSSTDPAKTAKPAKSQTWTFSISIGSDNPLQIKGTITSSDAAPAPAGH